MVHMAEGGLDYERGECRERMGGRETDWEGCNTNEKKGKKRNEWEREGKRFLRKVKKKKCGRGWREVE